MNSWSSNISVRRGLEPENYAKNARFVSSLGTPLIELLSARPGERILDLGCGDGVLTEEIQKLGCETVGVDLSPMMVEAAVNRGLDARVVDGHELHFANEFDAVFSNAALHWMPDPKGVIAGVWRALGLGGRFVAEFGGHGNVFDYHIRDRVRAFQARGKFHETLVLSTGR